MLGLPHPKERIGFFRRSASEKIRVPSRETPIVLPHRVSSKIPKGGTSSVSSASIMDDAEVVALNALWMWTARLRALRSRNPIAD